MSQGFCRYALSWGFSIKASWKVIYFALMRHAAALGLYLHIFMVFALFALLSHHTIQRSSKRIRNAFRCIAMIFATSDHANMIRFDHTTYTSHFTHFRFSLICNTSQSFWHQFPFKYNSFQLISPSQFIIFHLALLLLPIYSDFIPILLVLLRIRSQLIALLWGIVLYVFHIISHYLASHNSPLSCRVLSCFAIPLRLRFYLFWLCSHSRLYLSVPHTFYYYSGQLKFILMCPYHHIIPISFPLLVHHFHYSISAFSTPLHFVFLFLCQKLDVLCQKIGFGLRVLPCAPTDHLYPDFRRRHKAYSKMWTESPPEGTLERMTETYLISS